MFDAPFAFAFTAGIFATVNPCGFAMLPAYLSYFLGVEGKSDVDGDARSSLIRAITTGGIVSLGFLVVFGITLFILSTKVWPKITKGLEDRQEQIRSGIAAAEKASADVL